MFLSVVSKYKCYWPTCVLPWCYPALYRGKLACAMCFYLCASIISILSIWIFNAHTCESTVFMDTSVLIWDSTHLLVRILHETQLNKACKSGIRSMSICIHKALSINNHILSPFYFFNNFVLPVKNRIDSLSSVHICNCHNDYILDFSLTFHCQLSK